MAPLSTAARRVPLVGTLAVLFALLFAPPAAAHAELVNINPANGAQLTRPPTEVKMTFTESVNLVGGGIRLVDGVGATVPTSDPTVDGHTVTWPMPVGLSEGAYVVTWRVVSADGHPVSGASSFGVGTAAAAAPSSATDAGGPSTVAIGSSAPLPVVIVRLFSYVAFALFAGVVGFVLWCAPDTSRDPSLQILARVGLLGGAIAAVAAILLQGSYAAGVPMSRVLDTRLIQETLVTPFGSATAWRLALYGALGVLAWRLPRILTELGSWLVPAGVAGTAVTIAAAGHAAAGGLIDLGVDTLHVLTAGLWVGGLVALVVLGRSVEPRALHRFSKLAIASVLTLIGTGTLRAEGYDAVLGWFVLLAFLFAANDVGAVNDAAGFVGSIFTSALDSWAAKLILVASALTAAAVSRRRLHQKRVPLRSVRFCSISAVTSDPTKIPSPALREMRL